VSDTGSPEPLVLKNNNTKNIDDFSLLIKKKTYIKIKYTVNKIVIFIEIFFLGIPGFFKLHPCIG
jgi:hypothetical protein